MNPDEKNTENVSQASEMGGTPVVPASSPLDSLAKIPSVFPPSGSPSQISQELPGQKPVEAPAPVVPQKPEEKVPIKSLRTYAGDVEEAMIRNKTSAAHILVAEQGKRDKTLIDTAPPRNSGIRNKFFLILGSLLLVLGGLTVGAVYYLKATEEVIIEQKTKALIAYSQEKPISIGSATRESFVSALVSDKESFSMPVNSVLYINPVNPDGTPAKAEAVLSLLAPKMPSSLSRAFSNTYMLGIYSFDTNEPFIILTTEEFSQSFAGMLRWEKDMVSDLGKLFGITLTTPTPVATTTATTTPIASTTVPLIPETPNAFVDVELRNKDLRVLKNAAGQAVLIYSFIDKNTLLITTNENIFMAVLGKYQVSSQSR